MIRAEGGYRSKGNLRNGDSTMSGTDKFKNSTDSKVGSAKEKLGDATGNDDMQAEGKTDQGKADLKQAGEKVKDVFK
jgi:uncharacterized protein YjbJ (UPF0337 family)